MTYQISHEFEDLHRQVCEWADVLPKDYEKQEKFFRQYDGSPGFADWRRLVSNIWNREKAVIQPDLIDYTEEKLNGMPEYSKKLKKEVAEAKDYLRKALDSYNRQFVLYCIVAAEMVRQEGDLPLLHGITTKVLEKSCEKGGSLEPCYYSEGNGFLSQAFRKLGSLSAHSLGNVFAPLGLEEMSNALSIRMNGRGPSVVKIKKKPSPGTASS